ncbi:hypothetical protein ANN_00139 [Periplaneta americana]|uniref:Uncharacterized protein n=1 Tax=Periplaneta americana TaxID=6978 RepID=A0ABQ8TR15_PERAM|nr:hypothetical protein ANN_00139 [Periplaneta americana]
MAGLCEGSNKPPGSLKAMLTCYGTKIVLQWLKEGKLVINKISQLGLMDPLDQQQHKVKKVVTATVIFKQLTYERFNQNELSDLIRV